MQVGTLEKPQLINFIAKVMEDSGFKVYKNFKTSQKVIDIYAILPTTIGDFGVVVACKNYDKEFLIGVDVLKEMEDVQQSIKASKVTIVSSSYFSEQAKNYALRKNIKLVDRDNLLELAKKYQDRTSQTTLDNTPYDGGASAYIEEEYPGYYEYDASDMEYIMQRRNANPNIYQNTLYRQIDEDQPNLLSSILNRGRSTGNRSLTPSSNYTNLYNYQSRQSSIGPGSFVFTLISNPIVLIVLVVVVSYLISFIAGNLLKMDSGISGLIEMIVALLLSYGLSLYTDRNRDFIVKGTFIFFISLIILILLIFV